MVETFTDFNCLVFSIIEKTRNLQKLSKSWKLDFDSENVIANIILTANSRDNRI